MSREQVDEAKYFLGKLYVLAQAMTEEEQDEIDQWLTDTYPDLDE